MDKINTGWFSEINDELWPGQALSIKVNKVLYHERSAFQDILVFESSNYGNVLVLDGVIQVTERDEFAYQEMIAHVPLSCHYYPKNVLVVGGGDGGVVREILKHQLVEKVVLCEIDEKVIEVSKKYLPSLASALTNEKVTVHIGDGLEYMKQNKRNFDVIITDSSDPVGPASSLFEQPYYACMRDALKPNGIVCTQAENIWLHLDLICNMQKFCKKLYPVAKYCYTNIPTYPGGQIGFMICSLNPLAELEEPSRYFTKEQYSQFKIRFYNRDLHKASFVLPQFAKEALAAVNKEVGDLVAESATVSVMREREPVTEDSLANVDLKNPSEEGKEEEEEEEEEVPSKEKEEETNEA